MFNLAHILYIVISAIVTIGLLIVCHFFVKQEKYKRLVLKISAVVTVALHYSTLYVDFFATGKAAVDSTMLLPIYPCNVMMWLLVICAFKKDLNTKFAKVLLEFTFYGGVLCGIIGIVFNEIYGNNPTLADWRVLKGLLSHSVMVFGCIYILTGKFIKIRVSNTISCLFGCLLFLVDGGLIIGLYTIFKLDPPNCMYLLELPFPNMPWLNTYTMGIFALLIVFAITAIYEQCSLKKEERWYSVIRQKIEEHKQRKEKV